jgi:thiosulfate/3-mercaptopyruvate sulfurtransferase
VTVLVTTDWLEAHLEDDDIVIVEVCFDVPAKAAYFSAGHIPGAHYAWWKDLCWHDTDRQFPEPQVMKSRLEALGVSDGSTLVLVGDTIQFATYAYWVLELTGLSGVARVLDGGRLTWVDEGRPITQDPPPAPEPGTLSPGDPRGISRVGRDDVLAHLGDPERILLDLRSGEEFRGERVAPLTAPFDHGAERKGHIPGAVHLPHDQFLAADGRFKQPDEILATLDGAGARERSDVIAYCRLSHRATLGWFAATKLADRKNVRVYDGSWTEWGSIVGFPVER